jgi:hypothetical protein
MANDPNDTIQMILTAAAGVISALFGKEGWNYLMKKNENETGLKQCEAKCKILFSKIEKLENECNTMKNQHEILSKKYYELSGAAKIVRSKLKELGFEDITKMLDNKNEE